MQRLTTNRWGTMDFDAAMHAHANWKIKLTGYAAGIVREPIDVVDAGKDNVCALGQWLHGEGRTIMTGRPEYTELVTAHAEFHRQAAALVRQIDDGQQALVSAHLNDANSAYRKASSKVIGMLMSMKNAAKR